MTATVARAEGSREIVARLSPDNVPMRALLTEDGFSFETQGDLLVGTLATS